MALLSPVWRWISSRLRPYLVPHAVATRRDLRSLVDELKTTNELLAQTMRRESQLRAVLQQQSDLDRLRTRLRRVMRNPGLEPHVRNAIERATLHLDPFPYAVVDDLLPADFYEWVIRGLPPPQLFSDRPVNKQQLKVPFRLAPIYSQRVWTHLARRIVPSVILPAVCSRFRAPVNEWIAANWPGVPPESVEFHSTDGRILLRRRGYRIPPHRDPKWGFLTCIMYLARPGDSETWGTQLFSVAEDVEARGAAPHWVDAARCTQMAHVDFHPNRMLVFLNSVGAHGAEIPADAQPEALERYIYQFRIGPTPEWMERLRARLPEERQPIWAGKTVEY